MKELTVNDIIGATYADIYFEKEIQNPYFLNKCVSFCGDYIEKYNNEEYKTLIFQIKDSNCGVTVRCKISDDNRNIINGYDYPHLTSAQKNIDGMAFVPNLVHYRNAKPNYDWAEKLSKKYNLDMDLIRACGNLESIYAKMQGRIEMSPIAESFLTRRNNGDKILLDSLTNEEKENFYENLGDLNCSIGILLNNIVAIFKENREEPITWQIDGDKNVQADRLYVVKHVYDTDGGFGDAIYQEDVLFTTLDKALAESYIAKYSNPVIYDRPYSNLYHGKLELESIPFIHSMDITKMTPDLFGGVNTIGEKDVKEVDISCLTEEECL